MNGIGLGISNVEQKQKMWRMSELRDVLLHFDFSGIGSSGGEPRYLGTHVAFQVGSSSGFADSVGMTGEGTVTLGTTFPTTSNIGQLGGTFVIDSEYFTYTGVTTSGSNVTAFTGVTRERFGSSAVTVANDQYGRVVMQTRASTQIADPRIYSRSRPSNTLYFLKPRPQTNNTVDAYPKMKVSGLGAAGKPVLYWDGTKDSLMLDSVLQTTDQDFSVIVVARFDGTPNQETLFADDSTSGNQVKLGGNACIIQFNTDGSTTNDYNVIQHNTTDDSSTSVTLGATTNYVWIFVKGRGDSNEEICASYNGTNYIGGKLKESDNTNIASRAYPDGESSPSNTRYRMQYFGSFSNGASDGTGMQVGEILILDRKLTSSELSRVQTYLKRRWSAA